MSEVIYFAPCVLKQLTWRMLPTIVHPTNADLFYGRFVMVCRELLKAGCHLMKHFPSLLSKIGTNEANTSECMVLAITAARYT